MLRRLRERLNRYFRWDIYRRLLPYIWSYKLSMVVVTALTLVYSGLSLLDPWPMKFVIDNALGGQPLPGWLQNALPFLPRNGYAVAVSAIVAGLLLWLTRTAVEMTNDYLKARVNSGMILRFAADLYSHLLRLSFKFHDRTPVGDSIYRMNNDTSFISTLIWSNFRQLLTSVLTFVGTLWIVLKLDWTLAVLALALGPIQLASVTLYSKLFKERSKRIRVMQSMNQTMMHEVLSCFRVVKAFGQEQREQERLEDCAWTTLRARLRLDFHQGLFTGGMRFISKLNNALIMLVGAFHVLDGRIQLGELFVILNYVSELQQPMEGLKDVLYNMQGSLISAERVLEVLDVEPDIQDRPDALHLERVEGAIKFENVCFAYESERPVLHHINLTVLPGDAVAIVGPTGAGKTTLASLVARFYDPTSGRVLLDGHDLRELTVRTLRDKVALVLQEPILFSSSIRENIAYGQPGATMDEIEAAAQAANAHEFICALPNGYDSEVGERGVRLSGGERQRVAIARAFLKDAPVLILDEPTSSIDSRTEAVILDALDRLMVGRTTFIIAHRLSTIRSADHILVCDKGHIVERGTHDELLRYDGLYCQLHQIQSGSLVEDRKKKVAG